MNDKELYRPHIIEVGDKFAFNKGCERNLKKIHCLAYKVGVQDALLQILDSDLVEPEKLYEYFNNIYKRKGPEKWWEINYSHFL